MATKIALASSSAAQPTTSPADGGSRAVLPDLFQHGVTITRQLGFADVQCCHYFRS